MMRLAPLYRQEIDRAIQEKQEQIALNMLRAEVDINTIANSTELSLDRVLELQQQLDGENS